MSVCVVLSLSLPLPLLLLWHHTACCFVCVYAGNALVSLWRELHPSEPRPYTTLPSAFEGDRYLHLRLMATGGYQLQLDIAQLLADCTATMRDLQREWGSLTAGEVAAMAAKAASAQAAAAAAAAAVVAELDAVIDGQQPEQQTVLSLHGATAVVEGGWGSQNGCHSPDSGGSLPLVTGLQLATQNGQYAGSMTGSPSAGGTAALAAELAGPLPAKTQLPNMSQLLQLLQCAPLEVCDQAAVLLVPHSVQSLLFGGQAPDSMQQQQLLGDGVEHCYAAHGVSVIKDLADVNKMLDHLLACPIMAVGIACSSTSSGSQQTALLQLLAPPVGVGSGGGALDAAVYVFEVQQHLLAHEALDSCSQAMSILLSILFEDPNVVKLTEDAMRVGCRLGSRVRDWGFVGLRFGLSSRRNGLSEQVGNRCTWKKQVRKSTLALQPAAKLACTMYHQVLWQMPGCYATQQGRSFRSASNGCGACVALMPANMPPGVVAACQS